MITLQKYVFTNVDQLADEHGHVEADIEIVAQTEAEALTYFA